MISNSYTGILILVILQFIYTNKAQTSEITNSSLEDQLTKELMSNY